MKLRLPKILITAVMVGAMTTTAIGLTIDTATNTAREGDIWSKTFAAENSTYLTGSLPNDNGNRLDVTGQTVDTLLKGSIVVSTGKQLFLQTWSGTHDTGDINVTGDIYVGHENGIRVGMDDFDVTLKNIYVTNNASIYENDAKHTNHVVYIRGIVTDKVPTDIEGQAVDTSSKFTINHGKYNITGIVDVNELAVTEQTLITFTDIANLKANSINNNGSITFTNAPGAIADLLSKTTGSGTFVINGNSYLAGNTDSGGKVYNYAGKLQINSGATLQMGGDGSSNYNSLWSLHMDKAELVLNGGTVKYYGGASSIGKVTTSAQSTLDMFATKQSEGAFETLTIKEMTVAQKLTVTGSWESKLSIESLTLNNDLHVNAHTAANGKNAYITIGKLSGSGMLQLLKGHAILEKGEHSISRVDISVGNTECFGSLTLREEAVLNINHNLWLGDENINNADKENPQIVLENKAALTRDIVTVKGRSEGTLIIRNDETGEGTKGDAYNIDNVTYTFRNADVEVKTAQSGNTISNRLENVTLYNTGEGKLVAGNGNNYYSGIVAKNGDIEINGFANLATQSSLSLLEVAAHKTVSINNKWNNNRTKANVSVSGTASFDEASILQANLTLKSGATLILDAWGEDAASVSGSLTLETNLTLKGDILTALYDLDKNESLAVFNNVSELVLFGQSESPVLTLDSSTMAGIDASTYFSNLEEGIFYISHVGQQVIITSNIPEPTTATLSLLALAALAARRRRK